jgi:hypothetical protein
VPRRHNVTVEAVSGATATGAALSEQVTWERCPNCGAWAAVGWTDQTVTEVDCTRDCELTQEQMARVRLLANPPPEA